MSQILGGQKEFNENSDVKHNSLPNSLCGHQMAMRFLCEQWVLYDECSIGELGYISKGKSLADAG